MAMLATVDDLNASQGTNFGGADPVAIRLLELASALVQDEAGQDFELVTNDDVGVTTEERGIWLPQRPINQINNISFYRYNLGDWTLDPTSYVLAPDGWVVPVNYGYWWRPGILFTVNYDHGYAVIPDDVIAIVCNTVGRQLDNPTQNRRIAAGTFSESTDAKDTLALATGDARRLRRKYRRRVYSTPTRVLDRVPNSVLP